MASIRDIKRYLEANIEATIKVPLRKAKGVVMGTPTSPATYEAATTKNTVLPIRFDGRMYLVAYDRRDIMAWLSPNLIAGQYFPLDVNHVKTRDLVGAINKRWGLDFVAEDIVDEPIVVNTANGKSTVSVKLSGTNRWFIGTLQLPVWLREGNAFAMDWSPFAITPKITANDTTRKLIYATPLTYGVDYNAAKTACAAVTPAGNRYWANGDSTQLTNLAAAMKAIDGIPWVYSTAVVPYNLGYSHCLYNGPTEAFDADLYIPEVANSPIGGKYTRYDQFVDKRHLNVLVLILNQNYGASNLGGVLFIHYGGPTDAITVETPYRDPLHWWPLNGDKKNLVKNGPDFGVPLNFWDKPNGRKYASIPNSGNYPIGATLPTAGDYTLSINLRMAMGAWSYVGIFGQADGGYNPGGLLMWNNGSPVTIGTDQGFRWGAARNEGEMHNLNDYILTVVKKGKTHRYYMNGKLCRIRDFPDGTVSQAITHFGKTGAYQFPNNYLLADIVYYDYAMTSEQVKRFVRGGYGKPA